MSEADYYPAGAYHDPRAPYNQSDPEPVDIDVVASITLSRSATISVTDYEAEAWEDWDVGDEGETIHTGGVDYNFSSCDLKSAFSDNEYTIPELLEILKQYAEADRNGSIHSEGRKVDFIIEACNSWNVDEFEVEQE